MEEAQEEYKEEEEQEKETQVQPDPEVEKRAEMMGWVPQERFKGDPSRWRPANEFVQRAEEMMPIMKAQMRTYETTIESLKGELKSSKDTMKKLVKMTDNISQREYEKAKQELITKQMNAVKEGDSETWAKLEQEKDKLEKPEEIKLEEQDTTPDENNPVFKEWHGSNDWYLKDNEATLYANAMAQKIQDPSIPYDEWLKKVENAVKKAFPHKFDNPKRQAAPAVDGGSQVASKVENTNKQNTYKDLPADAKAQCDKLVAQGVYTKEKYVQDYFEEE
jgi:hypothetical protein